MTTRRTTTAKSAASKPDLAALLSGAKLPEREVPLCMRGDLVLEHEAAERELEQAQKTPPDSLAGNGAEEIAERIQAIEAEMQGSVYPFRLRALPGTRYRKFRADHPIRVDDNGNLNQRDVVFGFNTDTGFEPLTRMCLVDPDAGDAMWAQLLEALTDSQFEALAAAAWYLNRGDVEIPFSSAASALMQSSAGE